MSPAAVPWTRADDDALRYLLPVLWMTSCVAWHGRRDQFKLTRQGATPGAKSVVYDCLVEHFGAKMRVRMMSELWADPALIMLRGAELHRVRGRAESPRAGVGVLGEGQPVPSPPARGRGSAASSPDGVVGQSPDR